MIGQNPSVYIMQVYTVLIHTKPLLRNGKGGNLTRETESITQATSKLILKSPPQNKNCPHRAQDQNILMKPVTLLLIQHYLGVLRLRL